MLSTPTCQAAAPVTADGNAAPRRSASVISAPEAFEALATEWNGLAARCTPSPMARHEWLLAAALAFPHRALSVFLVRDDQGRLRGAAPFVVSGVGPFERLEWLSHEMNEPQALLYDDAPTLSALWKAIRVAGRPLVARRLTLRAGEPDALRAAGLGLVSLRESSTQTVAAPVAGSWSAFEGAMSANSRSEMRRKRRGLEKRGRLAMRVVAPDPADVDHELDALVRLEASGWKGRERSAIAFRPALARFLRDYAHRAAAARTLRLFFLDLDGQPVAAQLLVEQDRRLWQFKIGYDERWAQYSPGRLLMFDILRWANSQGLETVEYLGHGGGWQNRWPAQSSDHATLRYYPLALSSVPALAADTLEYARRRADPSRAGDPPKRAGDLAGSAQPTSLFEGAAS